ncbi:MAG: response regulator [Candidatus Hermodarchaeota archaeon]
MVMIFVVDDDQSLQRLYSLILKEAGFEIIGTAINGKDALEKYHRLEVKPDIILMDHRMPIKNGLDTMTEILKLNNDIKIIFASADISVKEKAKQIGACAFLDKPFKMQQLLTIIQHIVDNLTIKH